MQLSSYIVWQINLITNPDPNIKKYCNSLQNKGHACMYTVKLGASEHFQIKKRPEYCIITVMIKCSKNYSNNTNLPKKKKSNNTYLLPRGPRRSFMFLKGLFHSLNCCSGIFYFSTSKSSFLINKFLSIFWCLQMDINS